MAERENAVVVVDAASVSVATVENAAPVSAAAAAVENAAPVSSVARTVERETAVVVVGEGKVTSVVSLAARARMAVTVTEQVAAKPSELSVSLGTTGAR